MNCRAFFAALFLLLFCGQPTADGFLGEHAAFFKDYSAAVGCTDSCDWTTQTWNGSSSDESGRKYDCIREKNIACCAAFLG